MTTHLLDSLAADLAALEMLTAAIKLKVEALQAPEPAAPAVPVTDRKIPYHALVDAIYLEFSGFTKGRASYKTEEFCDHCRPLLPLGSVDVALDCDGKPLWRRRFFKAHDKIAERRGFKRSARGTWAVPSEGSDG
jgi:hypothetical protein